MNFIGIDSQYETADGQRLQRTHFDGAASPLAAQLALTSYQELLPHYSNTHSYVHNSAQISTQALAWAHQQVLHCLGADEKDYTVVFTGSGTTAGINRLARGLAKARPDKPIALVSAMEHHANDLPHRQNMQAVHHIPLTGNGAAQGIIDIEALEKLLQEHAGKVNYVAFSAVSNVTGIINPIEEITKLAHRYDALVLLDAAQMVAHKAIELSSKDSINEIDFLVFSGHKVYTPGSPGVIVAKRTLLASLPEQDVGGGIVSTVSYFDHILVNDFPDREQAGTPNIIGAVALARVLSQMHNEGFAEIEQHGNQLMQTLIEKLESLADITIYGDKNAPRIGALAINHKQLDHGLFAAILNDYFVIAVRNECFCAHPYVSSMLKEQLWSVDLDDIPEAEQENYINLKRGMVRVSLSLYNNIKDIDYLIDSIGVINKNIAYYTAQYVAQKDGSYRHKSFTINWLDYFNPTDFN